MCNIGNLKIMVKRSCFLSPRLLFYSLTSSCRTWSNSRIVLHFSRRFFIFIFSGVGTTRFWYGKYQFPVQKFLVLFNVMHRWTWGINMKYWLLVEATAPMYSSKYFQSPSAKFEGCSCGDWRHFEKTAPTPERCWLVHNLLRSRWTLASNSLPRQNLIGYLIVNLS